jgi:hypothetical protein
VRPLFVGRQEYADEGSADATWCSAVSMLPTAGQYPMRFTNSLLIVPHPPALAYVYPLHTNKLLPLSCFLALHFIDGRSDCPFWNRMWPLVCVPVTMCLAPLYSPRVQMIMYLIISPVSTIYEPLGLPRRLVLSTVISHLSGDHLHLPCHVVGFLFVMIERYSTPNNKLEAMVGFSLWE